MRSEGTVLSAGDKMNRIGKRHTGIIHTGKIAEEVGECVLKVLDPLLLPEIKDSHGNYRNKHRKNRKIVNDCRREEHGDTIHLHHRDKTTDKDDQREGDTDNEDINGL